VAVVPDVGALVDGWGALADRVAAPPALHPGYLLAWEGAHAAPGRLRALAARREGELSAVLPLVMSRSGISTVALHDVEEAGIVAVDEDAALAVARAALSLRVGRLLLRPVPAGEATHRAVLAAAAAAGGSVLARTIDTHPRVDISTDWESYWRARSRNTRSDVSRRRRRLAELGEVAIDVRDGSASLDADLDVALRIEASGWKGRSGTALAARPADERFHRSLARWAAGRGWFRLSFLRVDGRPVAFHYSLQAHGVLYALKIGYAQDMADHSPGKVLLAAEIERAFADGCRRFDFAGSAADYKTRWATGSRDLLELSVFPPTPLGHAARWVALGRARATPAAKRVHDRLPGARARHPDQRRTSPR
jgi:CelD/BcsL family acetyltransferase involved in cellulose biosynthesis